MGLGPHHLQALPVPRRLRLDGSLALLSAEPQDGCGFVAVVMIAFGAVAVGKLTCLLVAVTMAASLHRVGPNNGP